MRPCILNKRRVPELFSRAGAPAALVGGEVVEKAVVAAGALEIVPAAAAVRPAVGAWTDAELKRAIRSGVSRDGRQLHWQGMTWDQFSNLDEEDLRAIVAYVRLLPPVNRTVPIPRLPAANDCETYTFYLERSDQPGCR